MDAIKRLGLKDWWIQRVSASVLSVYFLPIIFAWLLGYLKGPMAFYQLLVRTDMKVATVIMMLAYTAHIRVGLWVVITDYFPRHIQAYSQAMLDILLLVQLIVSLYLIWGF